MRFLKKIINNNDNDKFIIDYYYTDFFLRIFSIFWIFYVVYCYHINASRPESLYEPIIWLQRVLMPKPPSVFLFYTLVVLSLGLSLYTIKSKKIIYRIILFSLLLWLNMIKWNYNFFSHVGHLFLIAHFFTICVPSTKINNISKPEDVTYYAKTIKWINAGILVTYTMAGIWKFGALFYKLIFRPKDINWISEDAVELNAIVSAKIWDESVSEFMLNLYETPFIWEISTILIFAFQLIAVLGGFNKKLSVLILISLLVFHIYNIIFINTSFYTASFVLLIFLFPYHQFTFFKLKYKV